MTRKAIDGRIGATCSYRMTSKKRWESQSGILVYTDNILISFHPFRYDTRTRPL